MSCCRSVGELHAQYLSCKTGHPLDNAFCLEHGICNASNRLNPVWGEQGNRYRVEGTSRSDIVGCQCDEEARR